jgi:DNA-binding response OmpR family regulator
MAEILVIDDDGDIRSLVTNILDAAGHRTREASNGDDGMALCRARRPMLVITDIVMPEKEGLELIRDLSREMPDVPAVYLRAAALFGAVALLSKPFEPEELLRAVEAALRRAADPSEQGSASPADSSA